FRFGNPLDASLQRRLVRTTSMSRSTISRLDRRHFLAGTACVGVMAALATPLREAAAMPGVHHTLKLAPARVRIAPVPHPETVVWAFNGSIPGPELRVRRGQTLRVTVENGLAEDTT